MLKSVHLKNFKLHEDTLIEAAPITVFIGPNNSGKSSIFQALLLLRQAASRNDQYLCQPPGAHLPLATPPYQYSPQLTIDVGRFEEVVRQSGNDVYFEFSGAARARRPILGMQEAFVNALLRVRENRLVSHGGSIKAAAFQSVWEYVEGVAPGRVSLQADGVQLFLQPESTFQLMRPAGYVPASPGLPPEILLEYHEASQWLGAAPSSLIRSVHPIFALRGFEEWGYPITDNPPDNVDRMTLHDRALALPNALASDRKLRERLSEKLRDMLQISIDSIEFEVVPGKKLKAWARHTGKERDETLFANEGTGANQIPFIFVPILLTPPNETILLSEPEAHLHPKGQCELMRKLLDLAKKQNIQFLIETHSEHVLHVILNAIAKREWGPGEVAIYSFENVNGTAKATRLEVDEEGGVKGGLPGFFDQSLGELTEYLESLKKPTV
jgi:energy-coupling factor transporter ATP-binding protein EcfA2